MSDINYELVGLIEKAIKDAGPLAPRHIRDELTIMGYGEKEISIAFNVIMCRPGFVLNNDFYFTWGIK